jgi:hypothetical protein
MIRGSIFRLLILPAAVWLALGSSQSVAEGEFVEGWRAEWTCGKPAAFPPEYASYVRVHYAVPQGSSLAAFAVATLKSEFDDPKAPEDKPSFLFVAEGSSWTAYPLVSRMGVFNVFTLGEEGRAMLFLMGDQEGPGQEYTIVSTDDGFKSVRCGTLPPPAEELGTTDYMEIKRLVDHGGGSATAEGSVGFAERDETVPYRSSTTDGGLTWSVPEVVQERTYTNVPPKDLDAESVAADLLKSIR